MPVQILLSSAIIGYAQQALIPGIQKYVQIDSGQLGRSKWTSSIKSEKPLNVAALKFYPAGPKMGFYSKLREDLSTAQAIHELLRWRQQGQ